MRLAVASVVLGVVAVAGLALTWVASTTAFTPGNAIMATSVIGAAIGWMVSIALGLAAVRGPHRWWGVTALTLDAVALAGLIVLFSIAG